MKKGEIRSRMEAKGYTMTSWGRSMGLSDKDISLLIKINNKGSYKGNRGRCGEIKRMLAEAGFTEEGDKGVAK